MRILFIGCVESSYRLLRGLLENNIEVVGVITKVRDSFNSDYYDLSEICKENNIDFIYTKNINDNSSIEFIKKHSPTIGFCFGWSQLVKDYVINLFEDGIVGFHPAALPYNRGRHPLIWALVMGLKETASTFFMLDRYADTGDIVSQKKISIDYEDNARSLYDKIMKSAVQQELELVEALMKGMLVKIEQEVNVGNTWRKRNASDGIIDWRMSSNAIYNLVRGLTKPYAGASMEYREKEYKVWAVQEIYSSEDLTNIEPGKVLAVNEDRTIDIKAYDNIIRLMDFEELNIKKGTYL